jgi:acetoin utilization protein AcuB
MSATLTIHQYMTLVPRTIGEDIEVSKADAIMRDHDIRHLPVLKEGKLVGIVSDRDVKIAKSFPGPGELSVGDVMSADPYTVGPETPLSEVVATMIEHKYGSALVQSPQGKIAGIFTTIDALRALKHLLEKTSAQKAA